MEGVSGEKNEYKYSIGREIVSQQGVWWYTLLARCYRLRRRAGCSFVCSLFVHCLFTVHFHSFFTGDRWVIPQRMGALLFLILLYVGGVLQLCLA